MKQEIYDYIVIGSGFGGSAAALRLTEKGYSVLVLEEGRWFEDGDFPERNNNPFRFFWMPRLFCTGFQKITFFKHAAILGAAGVGGGSINYANTLLRPPDSFFESEGFPRDRDWKKELEPFYKKAEKMLRPTVNEYDTEMDRILRKTSADFGVEDSWYPENVAVFTGEEGETVPDPYFDGEGPERSGCENCAGCMIGCRNGAKNVLLKNYLYFALKKGAVVEAKRKVVDVIPEGDRYTVVAERAAMPVFRGKVKYRCRGIVFSAGVVGNLRLLHSLKQKKRIEVSDYLGRMVRTNSESLIGVRKRGRDVNFSDGVAITSGMHLDDTTHIEVVRYPKGANTLAPITSLMTDAKEGNSRSLLHLRNILRHPFRALGALNPIGWACQCIILLVMQTEDNCIRLDAERKAFGGVRLQSSPEEGRKQVPVYIPQAYDFARKMAENIGGTPLSNLYEVYFNSPLTAHILGGCAIGSDPASAVIDDRHRLFGYDNLYVTDASVIPANLGVNPVLTILALAERAMSLVPKKRELAESLSIAE